MNLFHITFVDIYLAVLLQIHISRICSRQNYYSYYYIHIIIYIIIIYIYYNKKLLGKKVFSYKKKLSRPKNYTFSWESTFASATKSNISRFQLWRICQKIAKSRNFSSGKFHTLKYCITLCYNLQLNFIFRVDFYAFSVQYLCRHVFDIKHLKLSQRW